MPRGKCAALRTIGSIGALSAAMAVLLFWAPNQVVAQDGLANPERLRVAGEGDEPLPAENGKKWHPGHYMKILRGPHDKNQSVRFRYYDEIANETALEGVCVPFHWGTLEGATQGDYASGFALVRAEIDKLKSLAVPKRMILKIEDLAFRNHGDDYSNSAIPQYIHDAGYVFKTNFAVNWRKWIPAAMDNYIALVEAIGAEFDDEPYFEGIILGRETAPNWGGSTPPPDYNNEDYDAQYRRLAAAASIAFERANVWQPINYLGSQTITDNNIAYVSTIGVGSGHPDIFLSGGVWADKTIQGISGGVDYRGVIPIYASVEATSLGIWADHTVEEVYNYANDNLRASHMLWDRNHFAGDASQQWATGILPFIRKNSMKHTECPGRYSECVRTE